METIDETSIVEIKNDVVHSKEQVHVHLCHDLVEVNVLRAILLVPLVYEVKVVGINVKVVTLVVKIFVAIGFS